MATNITGKETQQNRQYLEQTPANRNDGNNRCLNGNTLHILTRTDAVDYENEANCFNKLQQLRLKCP